MKISELIKKLQHDLDTYGDLKVYYQDITKKRYISLECTSPAGDQGQYDPKNPSFLEVY